MHDKQLAFRLLKASINYPWVIRLLIFLIGWLNCQDVCLTGIWLWAVFSGHAHCICLRKKTRESWCNASMSPEIHTAVMHNTYIIVVEKNSYQIKGILEHQGWGQVKMYHDLHFFGQWSECLSLKYNWRLSLFMINLHSKIGWPIDI